MWREEAPDGPAYRPVSTSRPGPDPQDIEAAADLIAGAERPVLHAGQGVHAACAWDELRELAERLDAPVCTTLPGKSAFPEDHPLALGSGGLAYPATVGTFLREADVIVGIGCSFSETSFAVSIPSGPRIVHLTLDPDHLNKDVPAEIGIVGDARLSLRALIGAIRRRGDRPSRRAAVEARIGEVRRAWLEGWTPKLASDDTPLSPYRVLSELMRVVRDERVVVTHDAGRPRDQLTPFWTSREPQSFIGWGKSTQLGYGLGLALGAKLARPDHVCINVWGDAAIGFTGTDLETAVRERLPILSILLNNGGMATEHGNMPRAARDYRVTEIGGDYAAFANALGCHAERITAPGEIEPAIRRGVEKTKAGTPVLLEFMTARETDYPQPHVGDVCCQPAGAWA